MIAVAKQVTHDWIFYFSFISGIAATWITLYFRVIRPRAIEHKKHEVERAQQRQEEHDWLHGRPATMSSPEIVSAPVKLQAVQDGQTEVKKSVDKLTIRMDEANGTARKTSADVAIVMEMVKTLAGRPPATVAEVKAVVAQEHDQIVQRQTEIMEALNREHT